MPVTAMHFYASAAALRAMMSRFGISRLYYDAYAAREEFSAAIILFRQVQRYSRQLSSGELDFIGVDDDSE